MTFTSIIYPAIYPVIGGALIGAAVTIMLLFNGRVTGISGIIASSLAKPTKDDTWRLTFLFGMILGGAVMHSIRPDLFVNLTGRSNGLVLAAGFLVGFGTVMGSGCTSGHGICGISRFSMRSFLATLVFMLTGILIVQVARFFLEGAA
jgi:uncharacterized membrane protein YedE/YeeE